MWSDPSLRVLPRGWQRVTQRKKRCGFFGIWSRKIERWSKILMPVLFFLLLALIAYANTLEGASEGLAFYLKPDFSKITGSVALAALGQAFFSLSLGMGLMILTALVTRERTWFVAPAILLILIAILRVLAWLFHGAALMMPAIVAEVVIGGLLLLASTKLPDAERAT